MTVTDPRGTREAIPGLRALLDGGYEITFTRDAERGYTVHTIAADGDGITACGATPAEALQNASPLAEDAPPLPWALSADGSHWRAELPDGRTAVISRVLGEDGLSSSTFVPKIHESASDFVTGPACDGVMSAAAWASEYAAENDAVARTAGQRIEDLERAQDETDDALLGLSRRLDALEVRVEELETGR